MPQYSERFWKKSWDDGLEDLDPKLWDTTIPEVFRDTFDNYGDQLAFSFQNKETSYAELDKMSNSFAKMLIENGFKKGDIVGINLPNIPEYLISVFGGLKAGCVISGVSPLLSDVQMLYQIQDLGAGEKKVALVTLDAIFEHRLLNIVSKATDLKLVVATSIIGSFSKEDQAKIHAVRDLPTGKVTPIEGKKVLDYWDDVINKVSSESVRVDVSPDDLGFLYYTGGTTGPPKGAMLTHSNIVANLRIVSTWIGMKKGNDCAISGFPFFHIGGLAFSLNCLFFAWLQVLLPDPRDTLTICNAIKKYKPRILANVPSLYRLLIDTRKFKRLDHSNLEICISGASPFPVDAQKEFESIVGEQKILELLGMTETAAIFSMNPAKKPKRLGTVGLPFLNTDVKIIDHDTGELVPIGNPGEICVKSPVNMKGYWKKPDETKNTIDSEGFIHTGDVGWMSEDGFITVVDRTKDMIIVGGFKVFSSKLEDTLTEHPAIGIIATIGVKNPDRPGSEFVKAFIQLDPKHEYDGNEDALIADIKNFAKERCAPYEVPKLFEFIEELPLTAVGKVDKKVLRQ
jgi:long-chain acyl-CoA synthetase